MKKIYYILFMLSMILFVSCQEKKETKIIKQEFYTVMPKKDLILNPHTYKDENSRAIITQIWEGICELNPDGARLVGAHDITHSDDCLNWKIILRDDLKWSDNKKIDALTFKKSWESVKNNKNANEDKYKMLVIKDIIAKDNIIEVKLNTPIKNFDEWLASPIFFPIREENQNLEPCNLIVNGAFKIKEYNSNKIILEKNTSYWDNINTRLKKIDISLVEDKIMAYEMFPRLEIDFIGEPFHRIPYERRKQFITHPEGVIFPVNKYSFVEINKNDKFLNDIKKLMYDVSDPEFMGKAIIQNNSPSIFIHPHPSIDTIEEAKNKFKVLKDEKNINLEDKLYVATYKANDTFQKRYLLSTLKEWISAFKLPIRVTKQNIDNPDFKIDEILIGTNDIFDFYYYINYKYKTKISNEKEFLEIMPVIPLNKIYASILIHSNVEGLNVQPNGNIYLKYVNMRSLNED